jgi:hypothetical protein
MVDRGRFRTTPKAIEKWFTGVRHGGRRSFDLDQRAVAGTRPRGDR